ncbi:transposase-like zinc-binding domain-containing protein [Moraxella equi]|uniref:IS1/IS1595 family N-terminal zinc-binding domain-containing protein n=1 Tax=Moraxella equi TaxID=60442 RepID=UPI003B84A2A8
MSQIFTHCPKCQSPSFVKAGFNNGKQRYKCKDCCYYFSVHKHASHKSDDIKKMAIYQPNPKYATIPLWHTQMILDNKY